MPSISENQRNKSHKHKAVSDISVVIGKNLKKLRLSKKMKQKDVGEILHVSYQQIQKYESGKNRLSAEDIFLLKEYFKVPFDNFYHPNSFNEHDNTDNNHYLSMVKGTDMEDKLNRIIKILCLN